MSAVAAPQLARTVGVVAFYYRFLISDFGRQNAKTVKVAWSRIPSIVEAPGI